MLNYEEQIKMFKSVIPADVKTLTKLLKLLETNEDQRKKLKDIIPVGVKSTTELIEALKLKFDVTEITATDLDSFAGLMDSIVFNACNCILNEDLQLKPESMLFIIFRIELNDKSMYYFENRQFKEDPFLYIVFEKHTGYFSSNSEHLATELAFTQGVSENEIDTNGLLFKSLVVGLALGAGLT